MCGHFNAVLLSEMSRTKTWAKGPDTMYNQSQLLPPKSQHGRFSTAKVGRQGAISALQDGITYHHDFRRCCHEEIHSRCLPP